MCISRLIDYAYTIEKPDEGIFDLDTTYDPASANIEGANFNTHYNGSSKIKILTILIRKPKEAFF